MKIAFDENIPKAMVDTFRELANKDHLTGESIHWARDYTLPGEKDDDRPWMRRFAADGGDVIITGDKRIRSRLHEQQVYMECGFVLYMFRSTWSDWDFKSKSGFLLRWWDTIHDHASSAPRPSCWEIPTTWLPDVNKLIDKTGPLFPELRR